MDFSSHLPPWPRVFWQCAACTTAHGSLEMSDILFSAPSSLECAWQAPGVLIRKRSSLDWGWAQTDLTLNPEELHAKEAQQKQPREAKGGPFCSL